MEINEEGKEGGREARERREREAAHPQSLLMSVIDRPDPRVYPYP